MYQTINQSQFIDAFERMNRKDNFSYEALELLFDYFEACEDDDKGYELDVIAICCDFAESTLQEVITAYTIDVDGETDEAELIGIVTDYLDHNGVLVGVTSDNTFVYAKF